MNPSTKHRLQFFGCIALICAGGFVLPGCAVMKPPVHCDGTLGHVSHPLIGPPFGPENEEDSLDTLGGECTWNIAPRIEVEAGPQWMYTDGGFYGDEFLFSAKVKMRIWERERR